MLCVSRGGYAIQPGIAEKARALVLPLACSMGYELIDVEYVTENSERYLRVYIDKRGGISIDDCEALSRKFSDLLDRENIISQSYILEISSPGLDRPLKTEADYKRYEGALLEVRTYAGRLKTCVRDEAPPGLEIQLGGPTGPDEGGAEAPGGRVNVKNETNKTNKTNETNKTNKTNKRKDAAEKKRGYITGDPDLAVGYLDRLEDGRVYLTDEWGNAFSLGLSDIKTAKRAIRF